MANMTRFKESKRIEAAIRHGNKVELEWAKSYCSMRVQAAVRKDHKKYWREVLESVVNAPVDSN